MSKPQFNRRIHPARARLEQLAPAARWLFDAIDSARANDVPLWGADVFFPLPALIEILPEEVASRNGVRALEELVALGPLGITRAIDPLLTMATWRMTQGIYRIDPAIYPHIIETPLTGDLPADALMRLPEWCIYVETPGLRTTRPDGGGDVSVLGAWARQDIEPDTNRRMLVVALMVEGDPVMAHQYLPLTGSVEESISDVVRGWQGTVNEMPEGSIETVMGFMRAVVNLLLYIASTNDFSKRGRPGAPSNPEPTRTRRHGWHLFSASGPSEWDVGVRMGAVLRAAYQREQTGGDAAPTGRQVRPHVRRAHWHTFVSGPRKRDGADVPASERKRELRWVPPIPVNVDDIDSMPATIRPVR